MNSIGDQFEELADNAELLEVRETEFDVVEPQRTVETLHGLFVLPGAVVRVTESAERIDQAR